MFVFIVSNVKSDNYCDSGVNMSTTTDVKMSAITVNEIISISSFFFKFLTKDSKLSS